MNSQMVRKHVAALAEGFGFRVEGGFGLCGFRIVDDTHVVNFRLDEDWDTDVASLTSTIQITASAAVASMGGNPTPNELLEIANTIQNAALLVMTLNEDKTQMTYTKTWR